MRALNTTTKNHRATARIQNKSHFCTDMKEQITLLHGYEKARPKSRFFALLKLNFSFYQFAKCVWDVSHFCFLIGIHNAYMPSVITDKSTHFIHVPKS